MGLAYDAKHDKLVMFGSQYSPDERTWLYDLKTNKMGRLGPRPASAGREGDEGVLDDSADGLRPGERRRAVRRVARRPRARDVGVRRRQARHGRRLNRRPKPTRARAGRGTWASTCRGTSSSSKRPGRSRTGPRCGRTATRPRPSAR